MTGDKRQSIALADKAAAAMREPGGSLSRVNDTGTHRDVLAIFDTFLRSRAA
jgi:hypothetical protein